MNSRDIARLRLINQRLASPPQDVTPAQLVRWMGCIQAQDYAMAKWAVGCRLSRGTDADIEKAFQEGRILRTHA
ncbi:MAG TPA: crosslink repair DNA glycosylase YcaQ family protein, partial [Puia sp.]